MGSYRITCPQAKFCSSTCQLEVGLCSELECLFPFQNQGVIEGKASFRGNGSNVLGREVYYHHCHCLGKSHRDIASLQIEYHLDRSLARFLRWSGWIYSLCPSQVFSSCHRSFWQLHDCFVVAVQWLSFVIMFSNSLVFHPDNLLPVRTVQIKDT